MAKERLLLNHRWALGDTVILTALVRDIHAAYPGRFEVSVNTHWTPVWDNNPHVVPYDPAAGPPARSVVVSYAEGIVEAGRGRQVHMLAWYHEDFRRNTGLAVPVTKAGADLHLSPRELEPFVRGRYWVVLSGGKLDMTTKWWDPARYQEVVDRLAPFGVRFVQCGAAHHAHVHPPLRGALNMVGRTENVRDFFGLVAHADGVVCGVTGAMHVAAALEKPCVVVAGGREEPTWEAYALTNAWTSVKPRVPHRYLHTVGTLPCCLAKGCWKKRTVPIEPADRTDPRQAAKLCDAPVRAEGRPPVPACLDAITPDHVVESVLAYYADGTLPPLR